MHSLGHSLLDTYGELGFGVISECFECVTL